MKDSTAPAVDQQRLVRLWFEDGRCEKILIREDMPPTATDAHQRQGKWKFTSPSRCLEDGLAIWTDAEMQDAISKANAQAHPQEEARK